MATYLAGLDLGQARDFSVLAILQKYTKKVLKYRTPVLEAIYYLRHLSRFELGTYYPDVVSTVDTILSRPELAGDVTLVIDSSGMGTTIYDSFRAIKKVRSGNMRYKIAGVKITPGEGRPRSEGEYWLVPKVELHKPLFAIYGTPRFKISGEVPDRAEFEKEMQSFYYNETAGGRLKLEAVGSAHDDYVTAVSLGLWHANKPPFEYHFYGGSYGDKGDDESIFELEKKMAEEEDPPPDDDEGEKK